MKEREWLVNMDFFEKVEETIIAKGQAAVDKAKELAEIAKLKGQISTCQDVVKKNYMEIGRFYYETYGECPNELFEKQCRSIKNAQNGIAELEKKIQEVKGI
ncbi:MAG: hypothetical protein E7293_02030 [Lachnospiraceae bacterium]|nr:hypothetical protein [Lachnospiraceae bacterium]